MNTPTRFREYDPNQLMLLPPDLRDWLPRHHVAYFILDVVGELDLSVVYGSYDGSPGGSASLRSEDDGRSAAFGIL